MPGDKVDLVVPRGVVTLLGVCATLCTVTFLPWAIWQTSTLMRLDVRMEAVDSMAQSLDAVRAEQIRRSGNVAVVSEVRKRLDSVERRLERIQTVP